MIFLLSGCKVRVLRVQTCCSEQAEELISLVDFSSLKISCKKGFARSDAREYLTLVP